MKRAAAALVILFAAGSGAGDELPEEDLRRGLLNLMRVEMLSFRLGYQRATEGAVRIGSTPKESARLLALPEEYFVDPWGTPYRIEIADGKFRIIGAGSDRRFDPATWTATGQFADLAIDVVDDDGKASRSNYTWLNRMVPDRMEGRGEVHRALRERAGQPMDKILSTPKLAASYLLMAEEQSALLRDPSTLEILRAEETAGSMVTLALRLNEYRRKHGSLRALRSAADPFAVVAADPSPMNDWIWGNDEWGTPFRVIVSDEDAYRIVSAGADRTFDPDSWTRPMRADPSDDQVFAEGAGLIREFDRRAFVEKLLAETLGKDEQPAARPASTVNGRPVYRVGGDVTAPVVVKKLDVPYPAEMKAEKRLGLVIVELLLDEQGKIEDVKFLLSPHAAFEKSVRETLGKWQFRPGTLNGKPVAVIYNLTIQFKPE